METEREAPIGSAEWADQWERRHGRENLDETTRRVLDECRAVRA